MSSGAHTPDLGKSKGVIPRLKYKASKMVRKIFRRGDKDVDDRAATSSLFDTPVGPGDNNANKPPHPAVGNMSNLSAPAISGSMTGEVASPATASLVLTASLAQQDNPQVNSTDEVIWKEEVHQGLISKNGPILGNVGEDPVAPTVEVAPAVDGVAISPNLGSASDDNQGHPNEEDLRTDSSGITSGSDRVQNFKDGISLAGRFAKTLLKKLPELVDSNPVKIAISVAKIVLEAKETIDGNKEKIAIRIFDILANLKVIYAAIDEGIPQDAQPALLSFQSALGEALEDLQKLRSASLANKILDYEETADKIGQIFVRIEASRNRFLVEMVTKIQAIAGRMASDIKKERLYRLRPSENANYQSVVLEQVIRREECAAGTRVGILKEIEDWANDLTEDSPAVFWLTGQAGSGKTTIATTIATMFDGNTTTGTTLGANFFCSRQFPETRNPIRIIPTLAYQLARKCTPFADALVVGDKFDAATYAVPKQLRSLFVRPWLQSESADTSPATYLLVIDALDELADDGSTVFLDSLFNLLNDVTLKGFKLFITSRSDPKIVSLIASFNARAERWLQRVPLKDVSSDIGKYLKLHLPRLSEENLSKLEALADGLFIHAATTVRYLTPQSDMHQDEQMELFDELLQYAPGGDTSADKSGSEFIIDFLYRHILRDALSHYKGKQRLRRLSAIHMMLSTGERSSPAVVSALLGQNGPAAEIVQGIVNSLHAVLYVQDGLVFWYHASFPDFIFDSARSNFTLNGEFFSFSCNEYLLQRQLCDLCFTWLNKVKFNICNIPSSFVLDKDHYDFDILLEYSAINWSHHLPISGDMSVILQKLEAFLELRALFWIELMNLVKQGQKCASILSRARCWVEQHNGTNADLLSGLQEVIDFTGNLDKLDFRRSTPHLYISHLATWSKGLKVIQSWKTHFQNLPVLTDANGPHISVVFTAGQPNQISSPIPPKNYLSTPYSAAFLHNNQIVTGHKDGLVCVWNVSDGRLLQELHGHKGDVNSVAVASDVNWIISGSDDKTVQIWNVNGNLLHTLNGHTLFVRSVAVPQDGTRIVLGSWDDTVIIWDLKSGQWQSRTLTGHTDTVQSVAISLTGLYTISGSADNTVCIWDTSTGELLHSLEGHTDEVNSVAISSDNAWVVSGSDDTTVRVWSVSTGKQIFCMNGHQGPVYGVAISPDRKTIATGGDDKRVQVWNATGQQVHVLCGHQGSIISVAFSSDGSQIVTCAHHDSIRVWDTTSHQKLVLLDSSSKESAASAHAYASVEDWVSAVDPKCAQWTILEDGWIVSTDSDQSHWLMWVDLQDLNVQDPSNLLTISKQNYCSIDFSNSFDILGENWVTCYIPA